MSSKYLLDERQHFINGIGTELAWGWSPAIDFTLLLPQREEGGERITSAPAPACVDVDNKTMKTNERPCGAPEMHVSGGATRTELDLDSMISAIQQRRHERVLEDDEDDNNGSSGPRVLLCGACDIRHIFRTLSSLRLSAAQSPDKPSQTWHFFIYEPNLRIHARHLFFIKWLIDSMFSLAELEERVLMFLDVFGNALTRDTTAAQIRSVAQQLLNSMRGDEADDLSRLVTFDEMKSKERDFVEQQIMHWTRDGSLARMEETRSRRLRQEMAERYDNRDNIIDWDFNFYLHDYTNLLKFAEYRTWRNNGVAFDATHINPRRGCTYDYSVPNKTLCHFNSKGDGVFLGDVKNGPFFAFGAQTANTHIRARTFDGTCKYGNGIISMHNVRAWLYCLMTGMEWPWSDHLFAWDDPAHYNWLPEGTPSDITHQTTLPRVKFHFIGLDIERFLLRMRERQRKRFDLAFVGTSCTQYMTPAFFTTAMADDAVVVAETAKFVVDARDEAKTAFVDKISELANAAGWATDDELTNRLHCDQPEPPKVDDNSSNKAAEVSYRRYMMPYQIALTQSKRG
ncbi:hypothetical protein TRVL_01012 [Trypanosoma vivax]|nr:hypothetical protein TRVL_01012 [Trypanosoma vivax]